MRTSNAEHQRKAPRPDLCGAAAARRGAELRHGLRDGCAKRNRRAVKVEKSFGTTAAALSCDTSSQPGIMCALCPHLEGKSQTVSEAVPAVPGAELPPGS